LNRAFQDRWIQVRNVPDQLAVRLLERDLDRGEAAAIILARELNADWLLLDEREGRKFAKRLELRVTGTLGVLLRAKRDGAIPSLQRVMDSLRDLAGFYIAPKLYAELLQASGERL
jgi:predicted nucleic acid-binding protein